MSQQNGQNKKINKIIKAKFTMAGRVSAFDDNSQINFYAKIYALALRRVKRT